MPLLTATNAHDDAIGVVFCDAGLGVVFVDPEGDVFSDEREAVIFYSTGVGWVFVEKIQVTSSDDAKQVANSLWLSGKHEVLVLCLN